MRGLEPVAAGGGGAGLGHKVVLAVGIARAPQREDSEDPEGGSPDTEAEQLLACARLDGAALLGLHERTVRPASNLETLKTSTAGFRVRGSHF